MIGCECNYFPHVHPIVMKPSVICIQKINTIFVYFINNISYDNMENKYQILFLKRLIWFKHFILNSQQAYLLLNYRLSKILFITRLQVVISITLSFCTTYLIEIG